MPSPDTRPAVIVTEPEFRRAESTFSAVPTLRCIPAPVAEADLAAAIARAHARYAIIGHAPYRGPLYDALPRGGVLARFGVGYEGLDLPKATRAGIYCTNTPGVLDQSVAELAMLLVAAGVRHLPAMDHALRTGQWRPAQGLELEGRTLALIGFGRIARALARLAGGGFGMRVIGFGRRAGIEPSPYVADITTNYLQAVRDAEVVSVHLPATPENSPFFTAARLAALRPGTWLVNTARGAVLDEDALFDALASGHLGGAALDVFTREPYEPLDPARDLRTLPNVVLTPHVGSHTVASNRRMAARALRNVELAVAGRFPEMDVLNPDVVPPPRA